MIPLAFLGLSTEQWLYVFGSILTVYGAWIVAKMGAKANAAKVVADKELGSGQMALDLARELREEVKSLRHFRNRVTRWWGDHEDWDDLVLEELERLDPGATSRVGRPPRLPDEDAHGEIQL